MLDSLMIDPHWILAYRTDTLTRFFTAFSQYFSYYLYMYIIALGYWLWPKNKPFIDLGFLFPFTVVVNSLIKGFAQLPRPDESLHLIKAFGPHGFPSGDAQLSTVFWLVILLSWTSSRLRYLCLIPIVLSSSSRVYLGIHSLYDVLGGLFLGALVVYLFYMPALNHYVMRWYKDSRMSYWLLMGVTFGLYAMVYRHLTLDPFIFSFMGLLLGYGVAMPWIAEKEPGIGFSYPIESYMSIAIAVIVIYSFVMYTNVSALTSMPIINFSAVILKYMLVSIAIFAITPKFIKRAQS
jgi:membrane-associated phospholipid phosphatase